MRGSVHRRQDHTVEYWSDIELLGVTKGRIQIWHMYYLGSQVTTNIFGSGELEDIFRDES
jgi:hypothetical protein